VGIIHTAVAAGDIAMNHVATSEELHLNRFQGCRAPAATYVGVFSLINDVQSFPELKLSNV